MNWNGARDTIRCLASLAASRPPLSGIHVVDNGSTDDSVARIRAEQPGVVLHLNAANEGFAAAANRGIRAALATGAGWVLLMNNDATLDPDAVVRLLEAGASEPRAGLIGGKIYRDRPRRILWCCGVALGFGPNIGRLRGFGRVDDGRYDRREAVDSLTGCALLVRRAVFDEVGVLDEGYFAYVEDADFAMRAREAGFTCVYEPRAVVEHPGGGSTGGGYSPGRKYLTAHGAARFLRRHGGGALWLNFLVFDILLWPALFVAALLRREGRSAWAKLRGTIDGLVGRAPDLSILDRRS